MKQCLNKVHNYKLNPQQLTTNLQQIKTKKICN